MTYWLSIVRFVPDPGRGEFINVGAIAGSDDAGEWEVRQVGNWKRAKQLDDRGTLPGVFEFITNLQVKTEVAQENPVPGDVRFSLAGLRGLANEMCNVVQITQPVPVVAASAGAALDLAFRELVVDPQTRTFPFQKKLGAVKAAKLAYGRVGIDPHRNVRVHSGPYDTKFDFAVANGRAIQLVRCWSFQLPNQDLLAEEVKAWAWSIRALRTHGAATLFADQGAELRVDADVDVEVVFVPPLDGQANREAFDVATDAFSAQGVGVAAVPQDRADEVAARAAARLGLH